MDKYQNELHVMYAFVWALGVTWFALHIPILIILNA